MSRRGATGIGDCTACKASKSRLERQYMACGYEPPLDGKVRLTIWQPPSGNDRVGYRGPELTTCAGYTARLPEVVEAAFARAHWKNSAIQFYCQGEMPTPELLDAILVLDGEYSALEAWLTTPAKDGGGGQ